MKLFFQVYRDFLYTLLQKFFLISQEKTITSSKFRNRMLFIYGLMFIAFTIFMFFGSDDSFIVVKIGILIFNYIISVTIIKRLSDRFKFIENKRIFFFILLFGIAVYIGYISTTLSISIHQAFAIWLFISPKLINQNPPLEAPHNNIDAQNSKYTTGVGTSEWIFALGIILLISPAALFFLFYGSYILGLNSSSVSSWFLSMSNTTVFIILITIVAFVASVIHKISTTGTSKNKLYQGNQVPLVEDSIYADTNIIWDIHNIDISDIESVSFIENSGKSYQIKLDSIKKIAMYIQSKYLKNNFSSDELSAERDFFMNYFQTKLSPENYKFLINTLTHWVESGGSFQIIKK